MLAELEERIAGERIRVRISIGVMERLAEVEDSVDALIARLRGSSMRLTRIAIREGMREAGHGGDLDKQFDDLCHREAFGALCSLAYRAVLKFYADAHTTAETLSGDPSGAAMETTGPTDGSGSTA